MRLGIILSLLMTSCAHLNAPLKDYHCSAFPLQVETRVRAESAEEAHKITQGILNRLADLLPNRPMMVAVYCEEDKE